MSATYAVKNSNEELIHVHMNSEAHNHSIRTRGLIVKNLFNP